MCDLYYNVYKAHPFLKIQLNNAYTDIKIYDKNIFPITDIETIDDITVDNISSIYKALEYRRKALESFSELPSIAKRNMKKDIHKSRNMSEMSKYSDNLDYLLDVMKYVNNRSDEVKKIIYNKAFKSGISVDDVISFFEDKYNLFVGDVFSKEDIISIILESNDMDSVYDDNNVLVVRVESADAIKKIGCTSFWCFTYGSSFNAALREWNEYSYNGMVYVIFDFKQQQDDVDFMSVVVKPIDFDIDYSDDEDNENNNDKIYDIQNNPYEGKQIFRFLDNVLGLDIAEEILTFEY